MPDVAVLSLLVAAAAALAVRRVVWVTRVASWSMAPTFRPTDLLLTRRLRRSERIGRGDVVVLRSAELGRWVVKRVVGLPGESVVVDGRGVTVNGVRLAEPYVLANGGAGGSFSVPDGAYLVLGDNRAESSDSRSWRRPFVARAAIAGLVLSPSRDVAARAARGRDGGVVTGSAARYLRLQEPGPLRLRARRASPPPGAGIDSVD